ncbi:hypothetical protein Q4534_20160 [Cyclobacterium sp. 1_MG-2023]|uniref:hypothetical protein n=1 Tax=Cyclobacterium sp. 1_MG-2023 TaxID=3062681 RepID=UPI0026E18B43|nr:hypothetical protein [Cyclobacterium sp. 1_MG-2023]MDO6439752.1 hypothetical protein [Cyclobacterium sp. 1_MG-2023]
MKKYKIPITRLAPCGNIISFNTEVVLIKPSLAKFTFWHHSKIVGSIVCEVGNMAINDATDFLLEGYFKSNEFKETTKKGGAWN